MDDAPPGGPLADDERPAATAWLPVTAGLVVVVAAAALGAAVLDPSLVAALLPGWVASPTAWGRTLQVVGAVVLAVPVAAAVLAGVRGRHRAVGWFVVLAVLALPPATVAISHGADLVRRATTSDDPDPGRCVERSGGAATCPGG